MSHFVECRPGFTDLAALVDALVAVGFERDQVEVHEQSVALFGYQGDERPQRANVVIRRQHVGRGANDVGWERCSDGTIRSWISEFDARHRLDASMQRRIRQEYACAAVTRQQQALGRQVERRMLPDGEIELQVSGYR